MCICSAVQVDAKPVFRDRAGIVLWLPDYFPFPGTPIPSAQSHTFSGLGPTGPRMALARRLSLHCADPALLGMVPELFCLAPLAATSDMRYASGSSGARMGDTCAAKLAASLL